MTQIETKETLRVLAETLRALTAHVDGFHRASVALYDALKREHPELETTYLENLRTPLRVDNTDRLLRRLDGLLRESKKV